MGRKTLDPGALLCPAPAVLISCGSMERPNVMTAAWTGIVNTRPPKCYVSIRPERFSRALIEETGELVVNLTTADLVRAVDFCGVRSGKTVDKWKECGLHAIPSNAVSAPTVGECPLALECRVSSSTLLGSHMMFLLDIVSVTVREELLTPDGRLALEKCGLLAYAHGAYYALGKKLGTFGYSVRKKKRGVKRLSDHIDRKTKEKSTPPPEKSKKS